MVEVDERYDLSKVHIDEKLVDPCPKSEIDARLEKIQKALKDALEAVGGSVTDWRIQDSVDASSQHRKVFLATLTLPANPPGDDNWQTTLVGKINGLGNTFELAGPYGKKRTITILGNFLITA